MNAADVLIMVAASPILAANAVVSIEVFLGILMPRDLEIDQSSTPDTVVLMPAHNEEDIIADRLAALQSQLPAHMRILLVADNCSDRTATVARAAGVEVLERNDPEARGKGFALAYGREHLRSAVPQCVVVLDADCDCSSQSLARLSAAAAGLDRPIQGRNLVRTPPGAAVLVQVSNFAIFVKNELRQMGLQRLGAPAMLNGTGMALPWRLFDRAKLATGSIVEDLELGLDLVEAGEKPGFLNSAAVWSDPASAAATEAQRSRWEGGFLKTAWERGIPLLRFAILKRRLGAFWLALHLMTPPVSMLVLLNIIAAGIALAVGLAAGQFTAAAVLGVTQIFLAIALLAAWFAGGRDFLSASALLQVPRYLLWKVPLYARLLRGSPTEWVRTKRD